MDHPGSRRASLRPRGSLVGVRLQCPLYLRAHCPMIVCSITQRTVATVINLMGRGHSQVTIPRPPSLRSDRREQRETWLFSAECRQHRYQTSFRAHTTALSNASKQCLGKKERVPWSMALVYCSLAGANLRQSQARSLGRQSAASQQMSTSRTQRVPYR